DEQSELELEEGELQNLFHARYEAINSNLQQYNKQGTLEINNIMDAVEGDHRLYNEQLSDNEPENETAQVAQRCVNNYGQFILPDEEAALNAVDVPAEAGEYERQPYA
ncbi:hypothetical protein EV180_003484, partial [Coemansia sp. RSA 518]